MEWVKYFSEFNEATIREVQIHGLELFSFLIKLCRFFVFAIFGLRKFQNCLKFSMTRER